MGEEEKTREQPESPPTDEQETDSDESGSGDQEQAAAERGADDAGSEESSGESGDGDGGGEGSSGDVAGDAPAAPSLGAKTDVEALERQKEEHRERLKENEPSQEDAMGLDKRRKIVGGTYGPTKTRLIATFSITIAVIVAIVVGLYLLVGELDKAPKDFPAKAPWAAPDAPQHSPKPIE